MVQIGNYHLGKADSAKEPKIDTMEASMLWDLLAARYLCIEETQIYHNYAHDPEFKGIIKNVGIELLERQAAELEKQMNLYQVPLPNRPPKSFNHPEGGQVFSDQYMFQRIFSGCQVFIDYIALRLRSAVTNDAVRSMLTTFLQDELKIFDKLCKYGKQKGWLNTPPLYKP